MTITTTFTTTLLSKVLNSKIPLFILILSILAGLMALNFTPREEEPQIVVPMIDVIVDAPGVNAKQVERLVTTPLEKLLAQVPGVEHVYSVSNSNQSVVTLRFSVGENREKALLNTYNKLHANTEKIPAIVNNWRVKPIEVDDVAIVMLALYSTDTSQVDDFALRRLAQEVSTFLQAIEDTSEVNIVGGRARQIQVNIDPEKMTARQVTVNDIFNAIVVSNVLENHGNITLENQSITLESGDVYRDINALEQTPISVIDGSVILLKDIANVVDGPAEQTSYTWLDHANTGSTANNTANGAQTTHTDQPMVTISVAKQRGSNAVTVANAVHEKIAQLKSSIFPANVDVQVLRDYGATANEKVNDLTTSLAFAVFTVVVFIGVFLGWRSAVVVGLAVPICYGITLSLDLIFGYTINRVTLFALILSLGLLVDDPITGVDNIERYLAKIKGKATTKKIHTAIVLAINEIRVPLLMSTVTIVLAFIPLAFITGMMGPYMAPMAFNVPLSVISSTLVAFLVTPWLAAKFIKPKTNTKSQENSTLNSTEQLSNEQGFQRLYRKILTPLLDSRAKGKALLTLVLLLFVLAALLPVMRWVPLKLLPFDNKNEVQVIIDMPESATLEQTAAMAKQVSVILQKIPEVTTIASYVGLPSPIDFNGMVRQYYQRHAPYLADLRVLLLDKSQREHQSHAIVLRMREYLAPLTNELAQYSDIKIRVVEVPPGPPVLSTLVAEIYGDEFTQYASLQQAASLVEQRLTVEPFVVEVDSTVGGEQTQLRFITDKTKAALSGISTLSINQTMGVATKGQVAGYLHLDNEASPLAINIKLPLEQRQSLNDLKRLSLKGQAGIIQRTTPQGIDMAPQPLVSLGELGEFIEHSRDKPIFHKDLRPVVYVTADIVGRTPAEVIADISSDLIKGESNNNSQLANSAASFEKYESANNTEQTNWQDRSFLSNGGGIKWQLPDDIELSFSGEGEWRITIRVFRDMGLAFAFALTAIFIVLRIQTGSAALSGIIMSAIPLTVIGIMPGFFLLNQFGERQVAGAPDPILFTATAMIGMIALAGIVVRNSLILIEFISQAQQQGASIKESLIQAGAVRMRPVLLTAGTTLLGNLIITLDPVFSGLAIAIIFGIISSTVFTLLVVPIVYSLVFDGNKNTDKEPDNTSAGTVKSRVDSEVNNRVANTANSTINRTANNAVDDSSDTKA